MMVPVFETVQDAGIVTWRFVRTRGRLALAAAVIYGAGAALATWGLPLLGLQGWILPQLLSWAGTLPALLLLAPIWAVFNRFVVLGEKTRGYLPIDVRVRRVLLVLFLLSLITALGGVPVSAALQFAPRVSRIASLGMLAAAGLGKLVVLWLTLRLAITPALAAAGTRKNPFEPAFAYSAGAVWPILWVRLLVYLPLLALVGTLMVLGGTTLTGQAAVLSHPAAVVIVTAFTAVSDFVDTAAMALIARRLAVPRRAAQALDPKTA
ncbi:MAG: hypothetical protein KGJ41_01045 [Rhodospirillales bacterium]|nr:hypothetical protein [Rhodospirillales bacterium]MDE2577027.1 hypothetical protein [Rhodospirillales bacterium]